MNPDILAAIAAYLSDAMGLSLASATGFRQVYVDYLPPANADGSAVVPPFAMVAEGSESYTAQSDDPRTGFYLSNLDTGTAFIHFVAPTKAQARALCRTAVRLMSDSEATLEAGDGREITLLPLNSSPVPHAGTGPADEPAAFERILTIQYMQQFLE